jgi:hypothetical protein
MYQQRIEHYSPNHRELKLTPAFIAHQARTAPMTWVPASEQALWDMTAPGVVFTQGFYNASGEFVASLCTYSIADLAEVYPSIEHVLRLLQSVCPEDDISEALAKWLVQGATPLNPGMQLPELLQSA